MNITHSAHPNSTNVQSFTNVHYRQLVTGLANVLGAVTDESDGMEEKLTSTSDTDEINDKVSFVILHMSNCSCCH